MSDLQQFSTDPGSTQFDHCEQCSAPVDRDQRYCVNCGNHRRNVPDPAAKYLSQASAHTGPRAGGVAGAVAGGALVKRAPSQAGGGIGLLGALALALIPVAAVIGVAIGRSSNNQDGKILSAIERMDAQTSTVVSTTPSAAVSSAGASSAATSTKSTAKKSATKTSKTKAASSAAASSSTAGGSVSKITGSKVTAKEQAQGSQEAQKIEKSTGKGYVQGANNLPGTVVVGP